LAKKALAAAEAAKVYRELPSGKFLPNQSIDVGALVELSIDGERAWFFLGPAVGGIEIDVAGELVTVITRGSPLGSQIVGKKAGDLISAPEARIESVQ
jgi:transcription elongation GreA/GreB family factor